MQLVLMGLLKQALFSCCPNSAEHNRGRVPSVMTMFTCNATGEMLVGPKKTLFMDEISTGLDSSTTFQIVKCMGDFVHLRQGTVLMSLLQPAPEVYNLFDDIMLLSEGTFGILDTGPMSASYAC